MSHVDNTLHGVDTASLRGEGTTEDEGSIRCSTRRSAQSPLGRGGGDASGALTRPTASAATSSVGRMGRDGGASERGSLGEEKARPWSLFCGCLG